MQDLLQGGGQLATAVEMVWNTNKYCFLPEKKQGKDKEMVCNQNIGLPNTT